MRHCFEGFGDFGHLTAQESKRDGDEASDDQNRNDCRSESNDLVSVGIVQTKRLEQAPQTVVQVQAEHNHRDDVKHGDVPIFGTEGILNVAIDLAVFKIADLNHTGREMQQVEDNEERDQTS